MQKKSSKNESVKTKAPAPGALPAAEQDAYTEAPARTAKLASKGAEKSSTKAPAKVPSEASSRSSDKFADKNSDRLSDNSPEKKSWADLNQNLKQALNTWDVLNLQMANKLSPEDNQLGEVKRLLAELKDKLKQFSE